MKSDSLYPNEKLLKIVHEIYKMNFNIIQVNSPYLLFNFHQINNVGYYDRIGISIPINQFQDCNETMDCPSFVLFFFKTHVRRSWEYGQSTMKTLVSYQSRNSFRKKRNSVFPYFIYDEADYSLLNDTILLYYSPSEG